MNHYAAGRRLEYIARDDLQRQGYTVIRSAGSKGAIDLCAIRADRIILIQVKKDAGDVSAGRRALAAVPVPIGVQREVWTRERGGWKVISVQ